MGITFKGESADYRTARDRLLQSEIALRRQMEAVAAERRALPPGPLLEKDYKFERIGADGKRQSVRLSDLFAPGTTSLLIYNMMFPRHAQDDRPQPSTGVFADLPREETPCPSCTGLLDQLDGAAHHFFIQIVRWAAQLLEVELSRCGKKRIPNPLGLEPLAVGAPEETIVLVFREIRFNRGRTELVCS